MGKCAARTSFPTEEHGIYISVRAITCLVVSHSVVVCHHQFSMSARGNSKPAIRRYPLTKDDRTGKICTTTSSSLLQSTTKFDRNTEPTHLKFNIGRRRLKFRSVRDCLDDIFKAPGNGTDDLRN